MTKPELKIGDTVRLSRATERARPSAPIHEVNEVTAEVIRWLPEHNLLEAVELSRFCFIEGYRENGRDIGARNPYELTGGGHRHSPFLPGGSSAYIVGDDKGDWQLVDEPSDPSADPNSDTPVPSP